jgi:hypothetical protein
MLPKVVNSVAAPIRVRLDESRSPLAAAPEQHRQEHAAIALPASGAFDVFRVA